MIVPAASIVQPGLHSRSLCLMTGRDYVGFNSGERKKLSGFYPKSVNRFVTAPMKRIKVLGSWSGIHIVTLTSRADIIVTEKITRGAL